MNNAAPGAPQPRAEGRRQVQGGGTDLEHRTRRGGLAQNSWYKKRQCRIFRAVDKDEPIFPVEGNHPLGPIMRPAHQLADRQRIEELIGDDQQRPFRQFLQSGQPDYIGDPKTVLLLGAQDRADLDEVEAERTAKFRQCVDSAQQIGSEDATAGPQFGEDHRIGASHRLPHQRAPDPDQLAKNLTDLRRSNEITPSANRPPGCVIAVSGS